MSTFVDWMSLRRPHRSVLLTRRKRVWRGQCASSPEQIERLSGAMPVPVPMPMRRSVSRRAL